METITKSNPLAGAGGLAAFTNSHDIQEGYPYGYTLFVQWQDDGTKHVVSTGSYVYPDSLVTGGYSLPAWPGWAFNA